ncbi:exocyst complex component 1-like isoform X2 [Gordionus sp. m RMFG-2023]|uniref:exocyst complex component 1-like isoform X2 n=1 Tax=Gordionus sp. m RMFG-2023 TaxID=3053472 RepID=UPI0031FD8531
MISLRKALQTDVFTAQDERLLYALHVSRISKRKKHALLCISANNEGNQIFIYKIKKIEKNEAFRKIACWPLTSLKKIDCHCDDPESLTFDIYFEKAYLWEANNINEKETFLTTLYKMCKRHLAPLEMMPVFLHPPSSLEDDLIGTPIKPQSLSKDKEIKSSSNLAENSFNNGISYQIISKKEEKDLEKLMNEFDKDKTFVDIEAFSEKLAKELSVLDGVNIYSLMGSELDMSQLMKIVDGALTQVEILEHKLMDWDETCLNHVRGHMDLMDEKDNAIHLVDKNKTALKQELTELIENLDYPSHFKKVLADDDLNVTERIKEFNRAAYELQKSITYSRSNIALKKMKAVHEKYTEFETLRINFSKKLLHHLISIFNKVNNKIFASLNINTTTAYSNTSNHNQLGAKDEKSILNNIVTLSNLKSKSLKESCSPFRELIKWLKLASPDIYIELIKAYVTIYSSTYEREIKEFFDKCKSVLISHASPAINSLAPSNVNENNPLHKRSLTLHSSGVHSKMSVTHIESGRSDMKRDNWLKEIGSLNQSINSTLNHGIDFKTLFDKVISNITNVIREEQEFVISQFDLTREAPISLQEDIPTQTFPLSSSSTRHTSVGQERKLPQNQSKIFAKSIILNSTLSSTANNTSYDSKDAKAVNEYGSAGINNGIEGVNYSMQPSDFASDMTDKEFLILLFPTLPADMDSFLINSDRMSKFYSLRALVKLMDYFILQNVNGNISNSSYNDLSSAYARLLLLNSMILSKRHMDKFMNSIIKNMEDPKNIRQINKSNYGGGVLNFVTEFPKLADNLEAIFKSADLDGYNSKRREMDKWYTLLVRAMFNNVNKIAYEQVKLPRDVVLFDELGYT